MTGEESPAFEGLREFLYRGTTAADAAAGEGLFMPIGDRDLEQQDAYQMAAAARAADQRHATPITDAIEAAAAALMNTGPTLSPLYLSRRNEKRLRVMWRLDAHIRARGYTWQQIAWHMAHRVGVRHGRRAAARRLLRAYWKHLRPAWLPRVYGQRRGGYMDEWPEHTFVTHVSVDHIFGTHGWADVGWVTLRTRTWPRFHWRYDTDKHAAWKLDVGIGRLWIRADWF